MTVGEAVMIIVVDLLSHLKQIVGTHRSGAGVRRPMLRKDVRTKLMGQVTCQKSMPSKKMLQMERLLWELYGWQQDDG